MTAPSAVTDLPPFDVCGPLPQGTVVLEASAGTGKTFTIAALATRYVAEGVAELDRLMLVTFGRAATQELRERVRERLVSAERGLADPAAARAGEDDVLRFLADVPDDEVALRRRRLTTALAGFDAATIATTHGFCQQMLAGLGMAGDHDPDTTFVENVDDLIDEVVDDLYLRKFGTPTAEPPAMTYACALAVARSAVYDRQAALAPSDAAADTEAGQRYRVAVAARAEVERRKRQRRLIDYDDQLHLLLAALQDPVRGEAARRRIRERYAVVLVDEFQDTDPVQWDILRLTFSGHTTLVLIGDPKQAIYAFRGGDVVTYLDAAGSADSSATLARNWRSDQPLLDAFELLFRGAALGDDRIVVRPVQAADPERRLPSGAPLRIRLMDRGTERNLPSVGPARERIAVDAAADIARRLNEEPLRPGDIAVLVRTNSQGPLIRDALAAVGVPAVLTSSTSVFGTPIAREWLTLLRALESPHRAGLARAAALTCFLGWAATDLADRGDAAIDDLGPRLRGWADLLTRRGVAALQEEVTFSTRLPARMLARESGERELTDLRHVGQALHAAAIESSLGITALVEWLQRRIAEAAGDLAEDRSRRLESDAEAVQIVTVHRSKGLEFPVVYVPFGWDRWVSPTPDPLRLHDEDGARLLYIGGPQGPGYDDRRVRHAAEECGEDLRLLYVAVTRAKSSVVVWWAPSTITPQSALQRLLFGDFPRWGQPPTSVPVPSAAAAAALLRDLAAHSGGTIAIEPVPGDASPARWAQPAAPPVELATAVFDRVLDTAWRRTSYSALTAAVHDFAEAQVGSEPEEPERADEVPLQPVEGVVTDDLRELRDLVSPLADLPAGTSFGTLVHSVLEHVDTSAADLRAELGERCEEAVRTRYGTSVDPSALADGLLPVLDTPLGALTGNRRLRDIPPKDRLAEMDFEMPLAGGDRPVAADATLGDVAALLRRHLPPDDPIAGYPDLLDVPGLRTQRLRGYLTGSLDAVLRVSDDGQTRYLIVDYKTNWLGEGASGAADTAAPDGVAAEKLSAWHYRPSAMADAMLRSHYPLQALLYGVALHRYLRWRQPGYDPAVHLGGVLYLYVRGMCGPDTPVVDGMPCGVFSWQPSAALIEDLSGLLAGR
jgi:exodeoxyribonuclease V beta subunit